MNIEGICHQIFWSQNEMTAKGVIAKESSIVLNEHYQMLIGMADGQI